MDVHFFQGGLVMLRKSTAIHILDACDLLLFEREDAWDIHVILENSSEFQVNRCYRNFIGEIIRQCGSAVR